MYFIAICALILGLSFHEVSCAGSCPPTLPMDEACDATCVSDSNCTAPQLCCPTTCAGTVCVDPVTERQFVALVKKGNCPSYPRGVWICTDTCSGDSDCPRALKCCPNRCGALRCQRPEFDAEGNS